MKKPKIVIIAGPTASGKSSLALKLCEHFSAELISADSIQVYRFMDIGTAKPTLEERERVAHHLIDIINPDEPYSAALYQKEATRAILDILNRGKNVIVCGGTGLYIRALCGGLFEGPKGDQELRELLNREAEKNGRASLHARLSRVDPAYAGSVHPNNLVRIIRALEVYELTGRPFSEFHEEHAFSEKPFDTLSFTLSLARPILYERISQRAEEMISGGLIEETASLIERGYYPDLKPMRSLGYKEVCDFLKGDITKTETVELIKKNTRNFAKRQITWFGKDPKRISISPDDVKLITECIKEHLQ